MAPSRTPRSAAAGSKAAKAMTTPKAKTAPNASILSFFKKEPKPDEKMFVGKTKILPDDWRDETGLYDEEPGDMVVEMEERYNEMNAAVKRRKMSDDGAVGTGVGTREVGNGGKAASNGPKKPTKRKGPFLDDSDSEEDGPSPPEAPKTPSGDITPQDGKRFFDVDPDSNDEESPFIFAAPQRTPDSPPNPDSEPPSVHDEFANLEDFDFPDEEDFEGEEYRERHFMEEQARIEAEEEDANYSCDETLEPAIPIGDAMTESCPICSASLAGTTPDEATIHVNACLDGAPLDLPLPPVGSLPATNSTNAGGKDEGQEDMPSRSLDQVAKRFARAAEPRPGQANPFSIGDSTATSAGGSAFAKLMSSKAEDTAWANAAASEVNSRGMPAYRRTCPFYKIMPGLSICVDAFRYGAVAGCQAYFLSHFHSDHYVGLTSSWSHGPIYCSKVTASLVRNQLRVEERWVVELEFEETVEVPGTHGVRVTMIPANHCPGSSLFLFEKTVGGGRTQRILHCGDFRACTAHVQHPLLMPETVDALSGKTKQQKIDICYLDTTYLNPRYSFPPQEDVTTACAELCVTLDKALKACDDEPWDQLLRRRDGRAVADTGNVSKFFTSNASPPPPKTALSILGKGPPPRLLVVCGTYSIGKERICKAIAQALRTKIFASPSKLRIVKQLGDADLSALMTSNPADAQVHMQTLAEMRADTLADYLTPYRRHGFARVVGFRPSGWNFRPPGAAAHANATLQPGGLPTASLLHAPAWRPRFRARDVVPQRGSSREAVCVGVPYSEHSSFRELALFVLALRIERVVPTVNVGSEGSRKRMKGWIERWVGERRRGGVVGVLEESEDGGPGVGGAKGKGVKLWDGKDGRGGGVYW